jgi:hypothetical protein
MGLRILLQPRNIKIRKTLILQNKQLKELNKKYAVLKKYWFYEFHEGMKIHFKI